MRRQKGAVYNVYAGADIVAADGTTVYQKGALVKENLVTGEDGSATLENLHIGTYTVTEMQAPDTLVCTGESKNVTLTAGEHERSRLAAFPLPTTARRLPFPW